VKYIASEDTPLGTKPVLEMTRRNLVSLLEKLDDPNSARMIGDPDGNIVVRAVEDSEHYKTRMPGPMYTHGEFR